MMKTSRYSESQIISILKQAEAGAPFYERINSDFNEPITI